MRIQPGHLDLSAPMPAQFQKLGIRFTYPENWTLDESEALEGAPSVTVYSPGGSFWSISLHGPETKLGTLVKSAVKALRDTYQDLDFEEAVETVAGHQLFGADVYFYCLDLTNTALVRAYTVPQHNGLILCQAEDREYAAIEPVFRAMTHSLLAGLDAASSAAVDDDRDDEADADDRPSVPR
jgi:hypothetical protein